jgi:addiction module HigA family antidote
MPTRKAPKLAPIHPGEILLADVHEPLALSQYRLAQDISVPPRRINEIVHGTPASTADTALRLARYCGTTDRFWLNLQARLDLETQRDALGPRLAREVGSFEHASERASLHSSDLRCGGGSAAAFYLIRLQHGLGVDMTGLGSSGQCKGWTYGMIAVRRRRETAATVDHADIRR